MFLLSRMPYILIASHFSHAQWTQAYKNNHFQPKRWKSKVKHWLVHSMPKQSHRQPPGRSHSRSLSLRVDFNYSLHRHRIHPFLSFWHNLANYTAFCLLQAYNFSFSLSWFNLFPHRLSAPSSLYEHHISFSKDHNVKHLGKNTSEHCCKNYRIKAIILIMSLDMVQDPCRANVVSIFCHWRKASKTCSTFLGHLHILIISNLINRI